MTAAIHRGRLQRDSHGTLECVTSKSKWERWLQMPHDFCGGVTQNLLRDYARIFS
ncbi:MAG: hypothetical protein WA192_12590 [Candidatus Acidiferrales bacterium]